MLGQARRGAAAVERRRHRHAPRTLPNAQPRHGLAQAKQPAAEPRPLAAAALERVRRLALPAAPAVQPRDAAPAEAAGDRLRLHLPTLLSASLTDMYGSIGLASPTGWKFSASSVETKNESH